MAFISQNAQLPVGAGECQGLGLALQVHFPNLCSGQLHEEVQKAQFSVEETGLGKEGGWPRIHKERAQCLGPQEGPFTHITLRPAGGAGESLHLNTLFIP